MDWLHWYSKKRFGKLYLEKWMKSQTLHLCLEWGNREGEGHPKMWLPGWVSGWLEWHFSSNMDWVGLNPDRASVNETILYFDYLRAKTENSQAKSCYFYLLIFFWAKINLDDGKSHHFSMYCLIKSNETKHTPETMERSN